MRAVQPLPTGQASVTALLVERPELARTAEKRGVLERVRDPRLRPIVERTIEAAKNGERMPSEGELLDPIDPHDHRILHEQLFSPSDDRPSFRSSEDPGAALEAALLLCERDELETERKQLFDQMIRARAEGKDEEAASFGKQYSEIGARLKLHGTRLNELLRPH